MNDDLMSKINGMSNLTSNGLTNIGLYNLAQNTIAPSIQSSINPLWNALSGTVKDIGTSLFGENGKGGLFNNNKFLNWANLGMNAYSGFQRMGLMNDMYDLAQSQWNTQKDYMAKNYANSVNDYNRAIADVAATRAKIYGDPSYEQQYKNQYSIR